MSKERLEEIREIDQEISNGFALEDLDLNTMTVVNREHFEWLIEQAEQEHATSVQNTKLAIEFERLQLENKRYREALEFIGNHADESELMDNIMYTKLVKEVIDKALESESE